MTLTKGPLAKIVTSKNKFTGGAAPTKPPPTPAVPGLGNSDPNNPLAWNTQLVAVGDLNHQAIGGKSIRDQVPADQLPTFDQTQTDVKKRIFDAIPRISIPGDVSGSVQFANPVVAKPVKKGKTGTTKKTTKKGGGSTGASDTTASGGNDTNNTYTGGNSDSTVDPTKGALTAAQVASFFHALNQQPDMTSLQHQAAVQAANLVEQSVNPLKSQRQQAVREASDRAAAVMAAYRALANMTEGDTHDVQNAYQSAGQNIAAAAQGFTGQTGAIASKDAAALNNDLAHLPSARGVTGTSGFNILTAPAGGQNALYGINGKAPADAFFQDAADAYKAAQLAPRGIFQQGIDAMQVAQHASDSKEQAINSLINQAKAKLPGLTSSALTNLVSNWRSMHTDQLKSLALALQFNRDTTSANIAGAKISQRGAEDAFNEWLKSNHESYYQHLQDAHLSNEDVRAAATRQNARTAAYNAVHKNDPKPAKPITQKDIFGVVEDAALGRWAKGSAANADKPILQRYAMSDPGNAINYVETHTGLTQAQAIAALESYNGQRSRLYQQYQQDQFKPYDFQAYLASVARHQSAGVAGADIYNRTR